MLLHINEKIIGSVKGCGFIEAKEKRIDNSSYSSFLRINTYLLNNHLSLLFSTSSLNFLFSSFSNAI